MQIQPSTDAVETPQYHFPGGASTATITLPAETGKIHVVDSVHCSYDTTPTSAERLTITVNNSAVFQVNLLTAGPYEFIFPGGLYGSKNQEVVITLTAAQGGVSGKVNALTR